MHESNLRRIAAYLMAGNFRARFSMGQYSDRGCSPGGTDCGTCGCLVGFGPDAGVEKLADEDWLDYARRQLGIITESPIDLWLSAGGWRCTDNTPEGAARRALWMLEHGVPDDHEDQFKKFIPLCYQDFEVTPEMLDWQSLIVEAPDAVA